jgi:hypothetical protein
MARRFEKKLLELSKKEELFDEKEGELRAKAREKERKKAGFEIVVSL